MAFLSWTLFRLLSRLFVSVRSVQRESPPQAAVKKGPSDRLVETSCGLWIPASKAIEAPAGSRAQYICPDRCRKCRPE